MKPLFLATILVLKEEEEADQPPQQWTIRSLDLEGPRRRDRRYPRISLRPYVESPFKYLLDSGNDQALLNATGVDHEEFMRLLDLFQPIFERHVIVERTGRESCR